MWKKINLARTILSEDGFRPVSPQKLAANFTDLNLFSTEEQVEALDAALQEITPQDYSGARPPEKSYESGVRDDELFAFAWTSQYFRRRMYFKFCIHKEGDSRTLYVASLHKEKIEKRNRK